MRKTAKTTTAKRLKEYFENWLGTTIESEQAIVHLVEAGLPLKVINHLVGRGLSKDEVFSIIVNPRTLKHRKSRRQSLSKEESERAVRYRKGRTGESATATSFSYRRCPSSRAPRCFAWQSFARRVCRTCPAE